MYVRRRSFNFRRWDKTSTVASVVTDIAADALIKLLDTDGDVIREVLGVVVEF